MFADFSVVRPSKYPPVFRHGTQTDFLGSYGLALLVSLIWWETISQGAGSGSGPSDFLMCPGIVTETGWVETVGLLLRLPPLYPSLM